MGALRAAVAAAPAVAGPEPELELELELELDSSPNSKPLRMGDFPSPEPPPSRFLHDLRGLAGPSGLANPTAWNLAQGRWRVQKRG